MTEKEYKIGDTVHIYLANHMGETTEGKIVHIFGWPDESHKNYVIAIPTDIDPILEVRNDSLSMFSEAICHEPEPARPSKEQITTAVFAFIKALAILGQSKVSTYLLANSLELYTDEVVDTLKSLAEDGWAELNKDDLNGDEWLFNPADF